MCPAATLLEIAKTSFTMGQVSSFNGTYCVPVESASDSSNTEVFRFRECADALADVRPGTHSLWDYFTSSVNRYPDSNFLGYRSRDENGKLAPYQWHTYKQVEQMALRLGSSLGKHGLYVEESFPEECKAAQTLRTIGVFAKNCPEWFILEQACSAFNVVLVPLYDTLGEEAMSFIVEQTRMRSILVSIETVRQAIHVGTKNEYLENIILIEPATEEVKAAAEQAGLRLFQYSDLVHSSVAPGTATPVSHPDDVFTINYTSGTTGMPKGVLLSHRNFMSCVEAALRSTLSAVNGVGVTTTDVHISYLPLAHAFERLVCCLCWCCGAGIGCYSGDVLKLMDDIKVLEPTVFVSVPRLFNRIADRVSIGIHERSAVTRAIFDLGLNSKIGGFRTTASTTSTIWDRIVFNKTKRLLGSRLRFMVTGGAPLDPSVHEKMQAFFCVPLLQGYGLTETVGPAFLCHREDTAVGHIGGLFPSVEFKLQSVPEMNYYVSSNPPAGELCVRGNSVAIGYFRNKELVEEAVDEDGFFHTGDVVQLLVSNGVSVIDRKKNIFKLAQGEYIAPEKIENQLCNALAVAQVFVYGDSFRAKLVAIVNPDTAFAESWCKSNGVTFDLDALCVNEAFVKAVLDSIQEQTAPLKGFEKPAKYRLTPLDFSSSTQLMTPTQKLRRHEAKLFFAKEIEEMYVDVV